MSRGEDSSRAEALRLFAEVLGELTEKESRIEALHEAAMSAYRALRQNPNRPDRGTIKTSLERAEGEKASLLEDVAVIKDRLERIYQGDVGAEISHTKEHTKKFQRAKIEEQRRLAEIERTCTEQHRNQRELDECTRRRDRERQRLLHSIHLIDCRLIELEIDLKELEAFDAQILLQRLRPAAPDNLSRVPDETLDDLRRKADIADGLPLLDSRRPPDPPAPASPTLSREEERQQRVKEIEETRERYRQELEERKASARSPSEVKRWENFYAAAEHELDKDLKNWLR
jgi:hypothetical protein